MFCVVNVMMQGESIEQLKKERCVRAWKAKTPDLSVIRSNPAPRLAASVQQLQDQDDEDETRVTMIPNTARKLSTGFRDREYSC